ncbi:MAG: hypothetical protein K8S20_09070 [Chloroflexi bacterium]|nr:hypothetical protein [Chloroflexota bacterium]
MGNETAQVEQRIRRYWYVDGFGELVGGGGMCLILALYFSAEQYYAENTLIGGILQAGLVLVLIGGMILARRLIAVLKIRVTYPRTGFVEYRMDRRNRIFMSVLSFAAAGILAAGIVFVVRRFDFIDAMVAMTGLVMGAILILKQAWSTKVARFYFLSAFSLILGSALSVSGFARGYNLALFYGLMGIAFGISGGLTLARYLRENPMSTVAGNGG